MKRYGVGVLGGGDIGQNALALNSVHGIRVRAIGLCDLNRAVLDEARARYQLPLVTQTYDELLASPDIDIVGVYTPSHLHAEHVERALRAGKHVICTKPLCYTLEECRRIIAAVERSGKKLLVGQTWRWETAFSPIRQAIDNGDLGQLLFGEGWAWVDLSRYLVKPGFDERQFSWARLSDASTRAGMSFLMDSVVHPLDYLRWILGDVREVHAYGLKTGQIQGYGGADLFTINLAFSGGAVGRIALAHSTSYPGPDPMGLAFIGTKGMIRNSKMSSARYRNIPVIDLEPRDPVPGVTSIARYFQYFAGCIADDRTPMIDARDGAKTVATMVAIEQSVHTGAAVRVSDGF